jgi:hypothetical protein
MNDPLYSILFRLWKKYWGKRSDSELTKPVFKKYPDNTKTLTLPEEFQIFQSVSPHRIMIREEYIRIANRVRHAAALASSPATCRLQSFAQGVVVTGHPGVGVCSILSILRDRQCLLI